MTARTHHVTCCWRERSNLTSPREASLGTVREDATTTAGRLHAAPRRHCAGDTVATLRASVYRRLPTNYGRSCFLFGSPPWINRCIHKYPVFVERLDSWRLLASTVTVSGCGLRLFFFLPSIRNKRSWRIFKLVSEEKPYAITRYL